MSDDVTPADIPLEFTVHSWNPREESWEEFIRALERAYAQYVERSRHQIAAAQIAPQHDPDDPV